MANGERPGGGVDRAVERVVEHLFRREYPKLVAVLTSAFGLQNLSAAEDLVQDTLVAAMHHWSIGGLPDSPEAWLMQVAKNKALNLLKQGGTRARLLRAQPPPTAVVELPEVRLRSDIDDSLLQMMFACCHPEISPENQLALVLKTLCGFGSREVARALLVSESAVNKRLYRAKQQIVDQRICLEAPGGADLPPRMQAVCQCLYLLYNEGYKTTDGEDLIRRDLCFEAMRLAKLVAQRFDAETPPKALLALMCFHTARFESRVGEGGALVLLHDQDRSTWDRSLIDVGLGYLADAARGDVLSRYHLEASVAAQHCVAESFESTNWQFIKELYERLLEISPSPLVELNLAIVEGRVNGPHAAYERLHDLAVRGVLADYPLLHASLGQVLAELGRRREALVQLERALGMTQSAAERRFLALRVGEVEAECRTAEPERPE